MVAGCGDPRRSPANQALDWSQTHTQLVARNVAVVPHRGQATECVLGQIQL